MNVDRAQAVHKVPLAVKLLGPLGGLGVVIGVMWFGSQVLAGIIDHQVPVMSALREGLWGPPGQVLFVSAIVLAWCTWLENRQPKNPAPGELWRYKVKQVDDRLRAKLRQVGAWHHSEKSRLVFRELEGRRDRLRARYFPLERPPRRYRKLSKC